MLSLLALVRFFVCVVREVLLRSCGIGVRGGSHGIGHGGGDFGRLIGGDALGFGLLVSLGTLFGASLARRDLNALRTREVTLFTNSTGALVTVSTASTAEATESVISFTSSRI